MPSLTPIALDIETTGLDHESTITVIGFAHETGEWIACNTGGRSVDRDRLQSELSPRSAGRLEIVLADSEPGVLESMATFVRERIDDDRHYITGFNGETWNGGFDLPFLRTAFARHRLAWPFEDIAYGDVQSVLDRFGGFDAADLETVHGILFNETPQDPFESSAQAIPAYTDGDWRALLEHNLLDIQRTRAIAALAGQYVPRSDFKLKNLGPPDRG